LTVGEWKRKFGSREDIVLDILKGDPLPEGKKSKIAKVFSRQLMEMLKLAPENATIRSQAHARILVPLPDNIKTFEQIVEWVETNIDQNGLTAVYNSPVEQEAAPSPWMQPITEQPVLNNHPTFDVGYRISEREFGTYDVTRRGNGIEEMDPQTMLDIVEDAENLENALSRIISLAREWVIENPPETEPDENTRSFEAEDQDNVEVTIRAESLREPLIEWLRANAPEELARLQPAPAQPTQPPAQYMVTDTALMAAARMAQAIGEGTIQWQPNPHRTIQPGEWVITEINQAATGGTAVPEQEEEEPQADDEAEF